MAPRRSAAEASLLRALERCRAAEENGGKVSLAQIAERAGVSRSSAYRSQRFLDLYDDWSQDTSHESDVGRKSVEATRSLPLTEQSQALLETSELRRAVERLTQENDALRSLLLKNYRDARAVD